MTITARIDDTDVATAVLVLSGPGARPTAVTLEGRRARDQQPPVEAVGHGNAGSLGDVAEAEAERGCEESEVHRRVTRRP